MAILIKSNTPDSDKDFWATTWQAFSDAEALYGRKFQVDVAAENLTAKCKFYFAPKDHPAELTRWDERCPVHEIRICVGRDALNLEWPADWWCNPPFTMKPEFISAARRAQAAGNPGMMLLPYEPLTKWWRNLLEDEVVIYEPDGRYQFMERDGKTTKTGANFGCALVLFPAHKIGKSIRVPFERGFSMKEGEGNG